MPKPGFVYVMASKPYGTLYIGVTNNLEKRVFQHKSGTYQSFVKRYRVYRLVYFESFNDIRDAIAREKQLKNWRRKWKIGLIESVNPKWLGLAMEDLY